MFGTGDMANHIKTEHMNIYLEWKKKKVIELVKNNSNEMVLDSNEL